MLFPELIGEKQWNELIENASILQQEIRGIKVYLLPGQDVIKLFRIKRIFSWSFIYPYSMRFARNGRRLQARGIPTVQVDRIFYCHSIKRHGVIYKLMQGENLHSLLSNENPDPELMAELAAFMVRLHDKGIYFRSLHLGNVIKMPDGELGLIDIGDMRFRPWSLTPNERARNFRHLFRSADYNSPMLEYGYRNFMRDYLHSVHMRPRQLERLNKALIRQGNNWV